MATVPGPPTNLHYTPALGQVSATWSLPASNGGAALDAILFEVIDETLTAVFTVSLAANATSTTATGLPTNKKLFIGVWAHNSVGWSDELVANDYFFATAPKTVQPTLNAESIGIHDSLQLTKPSDAGVLVRLDQAIEFVFLQLTTQATRPDPDAAGADPYAVTQSVQPIVRLGLGAADYLPDATASAQLQGEIASGTLASAVAVLAHTTGQKSFTLTRTWTSDQAVTIYTMGVFNNLPISYAPGGSNYQGGVGTKRSLVFYYRLPTPMGLGIGDQFTSTTTITF